MQGKLRAKDHAFEILNDLSSLGTKKKKMVAPLEHQLAPVFDPKERK